MKISYGIDNNLRDITDIVLAKAPGLSEVFVIPASDNFRANIFGDHSKSPMRVNFFYMLTCF